MTAKDKAIELVDIYSKKLPAQISLPTDKKKLTYELCKNQINYIIIELHQNYEKILDIDSVGLDPCNFIETRLEFWHEVKKELEKM